MTARGPDAGTAFARALVASAVTAGATITPEPLDTTPYAAATFTGSIERLALSAIADAAFDAWLADLAEADLPMRRHIVVGPAITEDTRSAGQARLIVEALILDRD